MERMPHGLENATHFLLWGLIFVNVDIIIYVMEGNKEKGDDGMDTK